MGGRLGPVLATLMTTSLIVVGSTPVSHLRAEPLVEDFYAGKTITILIGFPPGGSYDMNARLAAAHLGRFVPGHPAIQVQSKPGGSGVGAVNYFTANAPKDGTMLGLFPETLAITQLTEPQLGKWNVLDFTYVGSFANSNGVFVVRKDAPAVTVDQMRTTPVHVGCNGRTGASYINPTPSQGLWRTEVRNPLRLSRLERDRDRAGPRRDRCDRWRLDRMAQSFRTPRRNRSTNHPGRPQAAQGDAGGSAHAGVDRRPQTGGGCRVPERRFSHRARVIAVPHGAPGPRGGAAQGVHGDDRRSHVTT